jgi:hypothetical protein
LGQNGYRLILIMHQLVILILQFNLDLKANFKCLSHSFLAISFSRWKIVLWFRQLTCIINQLNIHHLTTWRKIIWYPRVPFSASYAHKMWLRTDINWRFSIFNPFVNLSYIPVSCITSHHFKCGLVQVNYFCGSVKLIF